MTDSISTALPLPSACASACRVILDSNIWIDILVFNDAASRPIVTALESGRLQAVIDRRCLAELAHVLDYPQFAHHAMNREHALKRVAELTQQLDWNASDDLSALPKCNDPSDQKFLELACAAHADWLVSKDRALLKLSRRTVRDFGFQIGVPASLIAACAWLAPPHDRL